MGVHNFYLFIDHVSIDDDNDADDDDDASKHIGTREREHA